MAEVIQFHCPVCGTMLRLPLAFAGQQGPCPTCQREIVAPDPYRGIGGYEAPLPPPPVTAVAYPSFVDSPPLVPVPPQVAHEQEMVAARILPPEQGEQYPIPDVADPYPAFVPEPFFPEPAAPEPFTPFSSTSEKMSATTNTIAVSVEDHPAPAVVPVTIATVPVEQRAQGKTILILSSVLSGVVALFVGFFLGICYDRLFHTPEISSPEPRAVSSHAAGVVPLPTAGKPDESTARETEPINPPVPLETTEPAPSASQPQPDPPARQPEQPSKVSSAAEATLKAFLDAPDWASRAAHVLFPDEVRPAMEAYSREAPDGPTPYRTISVIQSQLEEKTGRMLFIFMVTTDAFPNGIPAAVKETPSGWQVDWQTFIEFRDGLFEKFVAGPEDRTGLFHLKVSYPEKKRAEGTENEHFSSILLQSLSETPELAYVRKTSDISRIISQGIGAGEMYAVLEVTKRKTSTGQTYLEIVSLKATDWFPREN